MLLVWCVKRVKMLLCKWGLKCFLVWCVKRVKMLLCKNVFLCGV